MRWALQIAALLVTAAACSQETQPLDGADLYARHCSACHGQSGEGDGPVAAVMSVSVPNLRTLSQRANGRFPREAVIQYIDGRTLPASHGDRYMPVWGNVFRWDEADGEAAEATATARIEAIADYLEQIQR